jgi:hypothetical protein
VSSIKRFRQYLLGRSFTVVTDCAAVKYAFDKAEVNARIGRWVVTLSEYDFKILHKKNDNLRHAVASAVTRPRKYRVFLRQSYRRRAVCWPRNRATRTSERLGKRLKPGNMTRTRNYLRIMRSKAARCIRLHRTVFGG